MPGPAQFGLGFVHDDAPQAGGIPDDEGHEFRPVDLAGWMDIGDGVRMVLRQFTDTLERAGIDRVVSKGVGFDPMQHEAIQHLETDDHPPGVIVAEVGTAVIARVSRWKGSTE